MDIALTEEQQLLRDSIRELVEKETSFERLRELERSGEVDTELWSKLATLGWLELPFEDTGGLTNLAIVVEELARRVAVVPYADVMAAGVTLDRFASKEVTEPLIDAIRSGQAVIVPAFFDASDRLEGVEAEQGGPVAGERHFVAYGEFATAFLVRTEGSHGPALRVAAKEGSTVEVTPLANIARTPLSTVKFDSTQAVDAGGAEAVHFLRDISALLSTVKALAYSEVAADMATEYVKQRVQFGRPLGAFQAVQHHCANMALLNRAARFLVYEAVWALENGCLLPDQLAIARAWTSRAAVEVTALAHQLHGGIGVTEEYDLHFYSRRAKFEAVAWGTPSECLDLVARTVAEPIDWS